jgi:hypothetical protein
MVLVLILIVGLWIHERNKALSAGPRGSHGGRAGGWHIPAQTAGLYGENLPGEMWNNGTTPSIFNSQWSGYDPPENDGAIVFAVEGGQDGTNPSLPVVFASSSQVTRLKRFSLLGGGDPTELPNVPDKITAINPVVRR